MIIIFLKNSFLITSLVLLAVFVLISTPDAFADHKSVTVQNAQGSSVPGCEPNCFVPSSVTIDVGGMVTWENNDSAAHTSTSGTPSDGADGMWDSSLVMSGQSYSVNLYTQGSHPYFCMVHPWMTGVVNVTADSSPPPPPPVTPSPPSPPRGTDITVGVGTSTPGCEFSNSCYIPSTYRVKSGSEISWYNADTAAHTVTAGNPADGPSGMFDSGLFMSGQSYSIKLDRAGTYDYFCMVHPWMLGTVVVSGGSSPSTPTPPPAPTISVEVGRSNYSAGDVIFASGRLTGATNIPVTILLTAPNANIIAIDEIYVGRGGEFRINFETGGALWKQSGTYTVNVSAGTSTNDKDTFFFSASEPKPEPVTPSPPSPPRGTDITVGVGTSTPGCEFSNSCYIPSTYRVKSGSEISWYNADTAAHTVTAGNPADGPSGMFDSGLFMSGQSYSIKLDRAGTYDYFCMVHPWMLGTVVVSGGSSQSTPTPSSTVSSLSVSTYSRSYDVGDKVTLDMNLNGAGSGENIAISVQNPNGNVILSRTATTNSAGQANIQFKIGDEYTQGSYDVKVTSSVSGKTFSDSLKFMVNASGGITITSVQPTDQQGNPVSSFSKGKLGFVKVILSADSNTKSLVTVNLFDSDLTSLGIGSFKTTLTAGQSEMVLSFFIPDDAEFGTGEIFANAFTNWPSQGGTPLTGESSTSVRLQ